MDEKFLIMDNAAFAYYFVQHYYRKYQEVNFVDAELFTFLDYFSYFSSVKNIVLLNSEKNVLLDDDAKRTVVDNILDNFCVLIKKEGTKKIYCVDDECLTRLRRAYDYASSSFKKLVVDYETQLALEAYTNKKVLSNNEALIRSDAKRSKSRADKKDNDKTFDA